MGMEKWLESSRRNCQLNKSESLLTSIRMNKKECPMPGYDSIEIDRELEKKVYFQAFEPIHNRYKNENITTLFIDAKSLDTPAAPAVVSPLLSSLVVDDQTKGFIDCDIIENSTTDLTPLSSTIVKPTDNDRDGISYANMVLDLNR